jgi:hypothetical protein
MNKSHIDQLLEKYWNVESTIEEETILKSYFASDQIDSSHQQYAHLFQFFKGKSEVVSQQKLSLTEELVKKSNGKVVDMTSRSLIKYAAVLIVLIAAYGSFMNLMPTNNTDKIYAGKFTTLDEEQEAQEAYEITMEALSFLSNKINTAESEIQKNLEPVQKAIKVIY